ncbi:MAG TPA: SDR family oxidoreductase [Solirubrobacteraceae bacterium]|jgi:citronellol/citronellal dehydrogenase|nr:SDR family oxidoreductase [Solirubrobacteraceae bacterium]
MSAGEEGQGSRVSPSEVFAPALLDGQVALVTGGGTGLGRGTAIELARCGAAVVVAGRREAMLQRTVGEISELGGRAEWVVGDVRQAESAEQLVATVLERCGRLDVLVNNAGGQYFTPAEAITAKGWRAVWRLNVDGAVNMSRAAYELTMRAAGGGTIVNVTLSPHHGMPGMAHSGSARAAVEALTRELGSGWAGDGISVVAAAAGHFDTEALEKYPEVIRAGTARSIPVQRLGTVQEHAWLVALLASPLGRAFSGSVVTLDGARDNWFGPWPPPGMAGEQGEVPAEARRGAG